jgi:hypothetical protein
MIKILLKLLFIFNISFLPCIARADFEADLAATGKTAPPQTLRELRVRAAAGDADSQLNMGGVFFKGVQVEQDLTEAAKWFHLAAQQGQVQAQFNLGMMYAIGQGVEQNHSEAVKWYRLAAGQKLAIAQLNLGVAYATGAGIAQDEARAMKWFRLAAVQGAAQAQFNLAVMYANGQGTAQNLPEAYRWAKLAAAQGHETAKALMNDLARQMTDEQQTRVNESANPIAVKAAETPPSQDANAAHNSNDVYVQLGAFKTEEQAIIFLEKMRAKLGELDKPYSIFSNLGWIRIHVGPYANQHEAQLSAEKLRGKLGSELMLKQHEPAISAHYLQTNSILQIY